MGSASAGFGIAQYLIFLGACVVNLVLVLVTFPSYQVKRILNNSILIERKQFLKSETFEIKFSDISFWNLQIRKGNSVFIFHIPGRTIEAGISYCSLNDVSELKNNLRGIRQQGYNMDFIKYLIRFILIAVAIMILGVVEIYFISQIVL